MTGDDIDPDTDTDPDIGTAEPFRVAPQEAEAYPDQVKERLCKTGT